ncbi:hypothetical protein C5167_005929 [Papaver somniferum]|uniref:Uncharacterized protein n=1 Tax=Papaver somniferum TaxID=3469 RepID=A0A4Y7JF10_PAPSO|nr:hypothetical protein C5167_005929 [Papaver somniferum]
MEDLGGLVTVTGKMESKLGFSGSNWSSSVKKEERVSGSDDGRTDIRADEGRTGDAEIVIGFGCNVWFSSAVETTGAVDVFTWVGSVELQLRLRVVVE